MASAAIVANATALSERDHHPCTRLDRFYILSDFFYDTGEFMSEDGGESRSESDPSPVALP
jgi:hypothetical protein